MVVFNMAIQKEHPTLFWESDISVWAFTIIWWYEIGRISSSLYAPYNILIPYDPVNILLMHLEMKQSAFD